MSVGRSLGYALNGVRQSTLAYDPVTGRLATMLANGMQAAAMEFSSHALAQNRLATLNVHGAIFTNLSEEHLDFHADMDAYFAQKRKLFSKCF